MKRYKRVMILAAVLVVACIATFALTRYEEKQENIRTSDEIIMQIPGENVLSVSWEYSTGDGLAFHKTDAGWIYQEDEAFPVSEEKVMEILAHFESYGVTFVIEDVTDYAQYGLDEPECTLHLATEERSYDIKMGAFSTMDEQRYISIGDGNVYLVGEDPVDYVSASLSDMILHDDTPGFEQVVDITFTGAENYTIVRTDESTNTYAPEDDIYFVERDGKTLPLNTASVKTLLNTITSLDLLTYASYNVSEEELVSFGLDAPLLSVTVNYTYTNEEETVADTCTIHISENPEERAASDAAVAEGETETAVTKYVRIGDSQIVYTMDDADFAILEAAAYDDLRHTTLFWGDFAIVKQMDIALEGEAYSLVCKQEGEEDEQELVWYYGETKLDITDVQYALETLSVDSFISELPSKDEEIGITLHLDNENFPAVEIRLYRYDGSACLAVVDGDPVALVPRAYAMDLVEAVQAIVLN